MGRRVSDTEPSNTDEMLSPEDALYLLTLAGDVIERARDALAAQVDGGDG